MRRLALLAVVLASCMSNPPRQPPPPPASTSAPPVASAPPPKREPVVPARVDDVVDDHFGTKVHDPYRWLEDADSPETVAFVKAENALTRRTLDAVPGRDAIHERLAELLAIGTTSPPAIRGGKGTPRRYFHIARSGEQDQPVLYVREGVRGTPRALVDPNVLSKDGTTAMDWWYPSPDGKLLAYGLSSAGTEESTLYVKDCATGKELTDRIPDTRFASLAWLPDNRGFYYTRQPHKGTVPAGDERYYRKVYFHKLGDDPARDELVFGDGRKKTDSPGVALSPDGRWLVLHVHESWSKAEVYLVDLHSKDRKVTPIAEGKEALYDVIPRNDALYVHTNEGAPRFAVYKVAPADAADRTKWRPVIPESPDDVLTDLSVIGNHIYTIYLHDVASKVERFTTDGKHDQSVALPGLGTTTWVSGPIDGGEIFYDFTSFGTPPTVFRRDEQKFVEELWDRVEAPFDPSTFEVRQERAPSRDGTLVPYFVVTKKGTQDDGTRPALIHAYGGFNISLRPELRRSSLFFVERGGAVVVANLRGGGEFGEKWHEGGMREHKQNVYDDLYGVAVHLSARKIAAGDRIAVWGGSNGGLLTSVAVTQQPALFRAVISAVPLTDMVRFPRFLIAELWTGEYGDPKKADEFEWLYAYSPYHHVVDGRSYPPTLLMTADGDTRVDPSHARKMAARLQAAQGGDAPILLRVDEKAGHGAGKPVSKQVEELTDAFAFLVKELSM